MSKPKNWPSTHPYLTSPQHSKALTTCHLQALRNPLDSTCDGLPHPRIPASSTQTPSPLVKIQLITNPTHPAHNQHGLFTTRDIEAGGFILAYLGEVHPGHTSDSSRSPVELSDYDLWIDKAADLAVDAAKCGNEARFVNDYRGVRERPNAEFRNVFCERWGQVCVGVWALGGGGKQAALKQQKKKKGGGGGGGGIKKGEEILVSYGKGFWEERKKEDEETKT